MNHQLTCFVLEVCKKDGSPYPPNLSYSCWLASSSQTEWSEHKDAGFSIFRASLDAEMKPLSRQGIGTNKKQAEVITEKEEELLWVKGVIGDETPQRFLDTVVSTWAVFCLA